MSKSLAPIALFVYNRIFHTSETLEALKKNVGASNSDLFIFSDGPKNENAIESVNDVRAFINKIQGFKSITVIERERNFGLATSIILGVTEVVDKYKKVIVLEDDLVTSPYFLEFMNESLNRYDHDHRIMAVHGYVYPTMRELPEAFFLRGADCWGWGTWKRAWDCFNPNGEALLEQLKRRNLTKLFDFDGTYPYTKMLEDQILGRNDSWAIRWYASAFLANGLTLYPGRNLVRNIGTDNSGTHCEATNQYDVDLSSKRIQLNELEVIESKSGREAFKAFFQSNKRTVLERLINKFKSLFRNWL